MNRTVRYFLFLAFFSTTLLFGQDTFDEKKHTGKGQSMGTVQPKPFQLRPLRSTIGKSQKLGAKQGLQMPIAFKPINMDPKFKHLSIKRQKGTSSVFIMSAPADGTFQNISRASNVSVARTYLSELGPLLQIRDATTEFQLKSETTDALGQAHLKMQQVYQGIKVYGAEVIVHINPKKDRVSVNGTPLATPQTNVGAPKISFTDALAQIGLDLGTDLPQEATANKGIPTLPPPKGELVLYPINGAFILAHHITVHPNVKDRWEYFIDAQTRGVVHKYYHTCTLAHGLDGHTLHDDTLYAPPSVGAGADLNGVTRQINTYSANGTHYLVDISRPMYDAGRSQLPDNPIGGIMTLDLQNQVIGQNTLLYHVQNNGNTWNNPIAVSAHYNAGVAYTYFLETFNRNSINGQGGSVLSLINVVDDDGGGLDNAYWNGTYMFYGNGREFFSPLAGSLDVAGHEMSHGVIENTANLIYQNQSGALNESFADIFGTMIDRDDWQLGEDVVNTQYFVSGALRDMSNPNNGGNRLGDLGWQPKDMTEYYTGPENNGGVHINSGIPNRAYYLYATAIGKARAEQIYYRALTTYLTASSQFIDLRLGVLQAATDLHGANSPEVQEAMNAFDAVGILDGAATETDHDIPTASGDDHILLVDVNPNDANSLYISDVNGENFVPLTTTALSRKPSVADDGSFAIYVTEDNTINAIILDGNNSEEFVLSDEPIWAAVSLSKDGSKLAAVRADVDAAIFIVDMETSEARVFELYNPTTAVGVRTGEVLYADALEWDYSGQYLIYDALNALNNANGSNIDYWDVGALHVWDNQTNTFANGEIQKIFTNLPEGISIGNPSFAKTSGNILAFDLYDQNDDSYQVITANIETGNLAVVHENNKLGFPNYSKNDDRLLFDTFNGGFEDIAIIPLGPDKLSPQGPPSILITDAIWGIWYTVGQRQTASPEKEITDFRFNVTQPASVGAINGNVISITVPNNINTQSLVATFTSSARSAVYIGNTLQQSGVNSNDFTNPVAYTVVAEDGSTKVFTVTVGRAAPEDPDDLDNDGVPNDTDQCPNTLPGTVVDVFGCPKFSLPSNNFRILAQGETCIASNNGSITINTVQNHNYTAILSGNGVSAERNFTSGHTFNELSGGTYSLCFRVQGQNAYEQCFDVVVARPQALSVTGKMDLPGKTVTLSMSGGERYFITLNNETFSTTQNEIELRLTNNFNAVKVTTEQDCLGIYEAHFLLDDGLQVMPNPIVDGMLRAYLPTGVQTQALVQIASLDGQTVFSDSVAIENGQLMVSVARLSAGLYVLHVKTDNKTMTQKIIIK